MSGTVYRLHDAAGRTLWVGCTTRDVSIRYGEHLKTQPWAAEIAGCEIIGPGDRSDEAAYAATDEPKYGNWNREIGRVQAHVRARNSRETKNGMAVRNALWRMGPRSAWYVGAVAGLIATELAS